MSKVKGSGTEVKPWALQTPPGTSDYEAWKDEAADPPALVVQVGIEEAAVGLGGTGDYGLNGAVIVVEAGIIRSLANVASAKAFVKDLRAQHRYQTDVY